MKSLDLVFALLALAGTAAFADAPAVGTSGTLAIVPAYGETTRANDEAVVVFDADEQDKDATAAASRVNDRMRRGTALVKREDGSARLRTRDYRTFPVYADNPPRPGAQAAPIVAWRVVESLEVTTNDLARLPKTVAAAQQALTLDGLRFGLSKASARAADDASIAAAYSDLLGRIGAIARAMGRDPSDAALDTLDYEGTGRYAAEPLAVARSAAVGGGPPAPMVAPSFEPGETTVRLRVVGKVRFR